MFSAFFSQSKIDISESSIERAKEGFTQVALRGAVLYDVTKVMGVINPLYCHSWQRFVRYDLQPTFVAKEKETLLVN